MAVESSVRKVKLEVGSGGRETGRGLAGRGGPRGTGTSGACLPGAMQLPSGGSDSLLFTGQCSRWGILVDVSCSRELEKENG